MLASRAVRMCHRVDALEHRLCRSLNRGVHSGTLRKLLCVASRLGDGIAWYLLMLMIPVCYGEAGIRPALQMAVVGLAGVGLYKLLKQHLVRERPYIRFDGILAGTAPLDRYSFPSGHTLHAASFTTIALAHFPELAVVLVPFALLVAASRVVLGLHYPTDVAAGAVLGAMLAAAGLALI